MSARASRIWPSAKEFLDKHVPEVKVAVAHGQMPAQVLEDIMSAFYDGKFDVLLSTTIVESGLDIPTANTLIVHRADMFGLAQLYQLRGRVGRSKLRAYALLTLPEKKKITAQAERRLKVLQSLDTLGAGFQLASHDLDIRGAGNLLGDEQSGHIKEVGFELYQQMLEEAVTSLKAGIAEPVADRWSPQIAIGTPVLIPEDYVADLSVRLALYRRLADLEQDQDIEGFGAELVDRFGPLPEEVEHLLEDRRHQGAVPQGQRREDRDRPEGRGAAIPRQHLRQSGRPDRLHQQAGRVGPRAARHEGRAVLRLGEARATPARHHGGAAQPGAHRRAGESGLRCGLQSDPAVLDRMCRHKHASPLPACGERSTREARRVRGALGRLNFGDSPSPQPSPRRRGEGAHRRRRIGCAYSGLMSPAAMILIHFSISRSTWARNSLVVVPIG